MNAIIPSFTEKNAQDKNYGRKFEVRDVRILPSSLNNRFTSAVFVASENIFPCVCMDAFLCLTGHFGKNAQQMRNEARNAICP